MTWLQCDIVPKMGKMEMALRRGRISDEAQQSPLIQSSLIQYQTLEHCSTLNLAHQICDSQHSDSKTVVL